MLTQDFKVPITIENIYHNKKRITATNINVKNLRESISKKALQIQKTEIDAGIKEFFENPLTIDNINFQDITINVEYYNRSGTENNWADIIAVKTNISKKPKSYLIKKIVFTNLQLSVYKTDGSVKNYPIIATLEINNISSDSGFPIDQLEKAIFNAVLKNIFSRFGLTNLLDTINPTKLIPRVFDKLPFFGKNEKIDIENLN